MLNNNLYHYFLYFLSRLPQKYWKPWILWKVLSNLLPKERIMVNGFRVKQRTREWELIPRKTAFLFLLAVSISQLFWIPINSTLKLQLWEILYVLNFDFSFSDPPILKLKWGNGIKARHIRQGNDVYFDCFVTSNPKVEAIEWYHGVW